MRFGAFRFPLEGPQKVTHPGSTSSLTDSGSCQRIAHAGAYSDYVCTHGVEPQHGSSNEASFIVPNAAKRLGFSLYWLCFEYCHGHHKALGRRVNTPCCYCSSTEGRVSLLTCVRLRAPLRPSDRTFPSPLNCFKRRRVFHVGHVSFSFSSSQSSIPVVCLFPLTLHESICSKRFRFIGGASKPRDPGRHVTRRQNCVKASCFSAAAVAPRGCWSSGHAVTYCTLLRL